MSSVFKSRRFWSFIASQVVAIALFLASTYILDPRNLQLAQMLIGFADGVAGILILSYTYQDTAINVAAIKAGTHPDYPPQASVVTGTVSLSEYLDNLKDK